MDASTRRFRKAVMASKKKAKDDGSITLKHVIHHRGVIYEGKVKVNKKLAKRLLDIDKLKENK